jgi:hypothetical protein
MARNIEGDIVYYDPPEPLPPGARPDFESLPLSPFRMPISDMRGREGELSVAKHGFRLMHWPSAVKDFHDPAEVARVYQPEVCELLAAATGCTSAVISSPGLVRVSRRAKERPEGATHTGDFAHADYSFSSGEQFLRRALPPEEAERRLKQRWSMFNVWRAFSPPPQDFPLALCDARSVVPADIQNCMLTLARGDFQMTWENTAYRHSPDHRWFYCSDMTRDEAFVFRSYDSDPRFAGHVPHTAFQDLTCPESAGPRASLEIRLLAFYED